ncbi:TPA: biosynthetic peptidoglycan transglycosylase [Neisseria subflava]|jgi:Membrane carboxypeptidase (penicillin-binding protein)|uniref:biosynthetic peptidoglycan transglycosylase n=1 Tax=unclassified Neisseria TaxID=2623750 RepID=UPI0008A9E791|nr:biosynthetic peptidoglycan transglycosylase [Neisseria sp. HMSC056A04]OHO82301.1 hypothetical protein HMPREF2567_10015 [Neisseria sp. HMSC056A04]
MLSSSPNNRKIRNFLITINQDLFSIKEKIEGISYSQMISYDDYDELHYLVMALEDRRFLKHCGVDFRSILRECRNFLLGNKFGGASTIDMQMVRTITGFKERTLYRKLYESILAFIVNFKFSKKQIIDCYLNNAFFGSHLYGIETTTQKCFGKYISQLTFDEKAQLAAMLQKPRPWHPSAEWQEKILIRARYAQGIRSRMKYCNK